MKKIQKIQLAKNLDVLNESEMKELKGGSGDYYCQNESFCVGECYTLLGGMGECRFREKSEDYGRDDCICASF
ncbi:TIGR04149 family rSAM-modified RiPP [Parabacteroides sp. OttesenSCG-928-G21]|nr:TIGR04149 family rSAM-modified RiPP [Parabacteroides sp. OttesenSCG-928-G21]